MNFRHFLAGVFFTACAACATAGDYVDVFPGTLVIWEGQPVLIRCDLAANAYILVDEKMNTAVYAGKIRELGASLASPVSALVTGSYVEKNGRNHLVVKSIENVRKGDSCHLIPPKAPLNTGTRHGPES